MICTRCHKSLDESKFYRKANKLHSHCKECHNTYCCTRWIQRKIQAVTHMGGVCTDCKGVYPYPVFEFHHRDPSTKDFSWGKMKLRSISQIEKELEKCDLLCANCHRLRHHLERNPEFISDAEILQESLTIRTPSEKSETMPDLRCMDCNKVRHAQAKRCRSCASKAKGAFKISWPSPEDLFQMWSSTSLEEVGRVLGVSGNAVKKHMKVHPWVGAQNLS